MYMFMKVVVLAIWGFRLRVWGGYSNQDCLYSKWQTCTALLLSWHLLCRKVFHAFVHGKWNQAFLAFFLAWAMLLASSWSSCWSFSMPCLGTRMGMSMPSCLRWPHCKLASSAVGAALTHENGTRMPSWSWDSEAFCFQLPMAHLAPKCCMYSLGSWPSLALLMGPSGTSLNCVFLMGWIAQRPCGLALQATWVSPTLWLWKAWCKAIVIWAFWKSSTTWGLASGSPLPMISGLASTGMFCLDNRHLFNWSSGTWTMTSGDKMGL